MAVLGKDRMLTIPIAGQARRVKAVHRTNYENESFVFVRCTPDRPTTLRSPPPLRVIEEENVSTARG